MKDIILGRNIFESVEFPEEFESQVSVENVFKPMNLSDRYVEAVKDMSNEEIMAGHFFDVIFIHLLKNFIEDAHRDEIISNVLDACVEKINSIDPGDNSKYRDETAAVMLILPLIHALNDAHTDDAELFKDMLKHVLMSDIEIVDINNLVGDVYGEARNSNINSKIISEYFKSIIIISENKRMTLDVNSLYTMYMFFVTIMSDRDSKVVKKIVSMLMAVPIESLTKKLAATAKKGAEASNGNLSSIQLAELRIMCDILINVPGIDISADMINDIVSCNLGTQPPEVMKSLWAVIHKAMAKLPTFELMDLPFNLELVSRFMPRISKKKELIVKMTRTSIIAALEGMKQRIIKSEKYSVLDNTVINVLKNNVDDAAKASEVFEYILAQMLMFEPEHVFASIPKGYYDNITAGKWLSILNSIPDKAFQTRLARAVLRFGNKAKMKPDSIEKIRKFL